MPSLRSKTAIAAVLWAGLSPRRFTVAIITRLARRAPDAGFLLGLGEAEAGRIISVQAAGWNLLRNGHLGRSQTKH